MFRNCFKRKTKNLKEYEIVFEKAHSQIQENLNMNTLLEVLMKIKASLTILVGDDEEMLEEIE